MTLKIWTRLWLPTGVIGTLLVLLSCALGIVTQRDVQQSGELLRSHESKVQDAVAWQGLTATNASRVVARDRKSTRLNSSHSS